MINHFFFAWKIIWLVSCSAFSCFIWSIGNNCGSWQSSLWDRKYKIHNFRCPGNFSCTCLSNLFSYFVSCYTCSPMVFCCTANLKSICFSQKLSSFIFFVFGFFDMCFRRNLVLFIFFVFTTFIFMMVSFQSKRNSFAGIHFINNYWHVELVVHQILNTS